MLVYSIEPFPQKNQKQLHVMLESKLWELRSDSNQISDMITLAQVKANELS